MLPLCGIRTYRYKTCPVHPSGLCGSADGDPGNDVVGGQMPNAWIKTWRYVTAYVLTALGTITE